MSDPTQNPPPDESGGRPTEPPPGQTGPPPGQATPPPGQAGPPPGQATPPPGQGSYGTTPPPPPPQGGYQQQPGGWQQPMPPPTQATGGVGQPADLLPRFVARLIDYLLLGFVQAVFVTFIIVGVIMGQNAGALTGYGMDSGTPWAANVVSSLISAAIALAYFSLFEAKRGQTLGKMVMGLETRGPDGGRPSMEQALKRNAFTAIGVLGVIPFLGFVAGLLSLAAIITIAVTINSDKVRRHGWHDQFAGGTTVFRIR